jgi:acyl-[acyl-carrier-protein]-phospholipid O-acyltransferase/long-chain-fatty-acid--[acyl-carrier-protein] ligase
MIFPEGRITNTGTQMKVYDAPAFVAAKTGADVVVAHIDGLVHSKVSRMTGDVPKKWFPRIRVTLCPPAKISMPEGATPRVRRRRAAEAMRRLMQEGAVYARRRTTLFEALVEAAQLHGRRREVIEDIQRKWTYADLLKASLALGRLASKFTSEGERVAVLLPNLGAHVALLFGLVAFRRTPAVLNYTAGAEGMRNACRLAQARVVVTSRAFLERARLKETVGKLGLEVKFLEDLRESLTLFDKLWLLWTLPDPKSVVKHTRLEDPAVVLFTSGSESLPKGVVLSHDSILANHVQAKAVIPCTSRDKFLTALPMFHSFGLCTMTLLPVLTGSHTILYPTPLHYRIIPELIYDRDRTIFAATTTFLANYMKAAHPYDFHTLRLLIVGAEKLTEEVRRTAVDRFGVRPIEGYGVTECSPIVAANSPLACKPGTVGQLLPGTEYRLEPVEGIDEGGVLHVKGPQVMLGYLRPDGSLEPPQSVFGEGWYRTGDVVCIDNEGYVTIVGRVKRFAKVAGEMVSLEITESIAREASPQFAHAAVSAVGAARGEMVVLFTEDAQLRREQLQQAARAMGAPELALPRRIVFLPRIPLLGNGKKDYVTLTRMAAEEKAE